MINYISGASNQLRDPETQLNLMYAQMCAPLAQLSAVPVVTLGVDPSGQVQTVSNPGIPRRALIKALLDVANTFLAEDMQKNPEPLVQVPAGSIIQS